MKVLIVVTSVKKSGGIRTSLLGLLSLLKSRSDDVTLLALENDFTFKNKILSDIQILKAPRTVEFLMKDFDIELSCKGIIKKAYIVCIKIVKRLFGLKASLWAALRFYKLSGKYDIAISYVNDRYGKHFYGGANYFVDKSVDSDVKIAWIHHNPSMIGADREIFERTYKNFNYVVNVSDAMKKIFDQIIESYGSKSVVVGNIVDVEEIKKLAKKDCVMEKSHFKIVSVARMDNQSKRLDRIIESCSMLIANEIDDFKWYIIGSGKDEVWLKKMAVEKKVDKNVIFVGSLDNPYPYMKNADIVCVTSDYETFGIVALEAIVLGVPVVTTNYPSAKEVLGSWKSCMIVDLDSKCVYDAISFLYYHRRALLQMKNDNKEIKDVNYRAKTQFEELLLKAGKD